MERYTVAAPQSLTVADNAGQVEAFLQQQGLATSGVVVRWDPELGTAQVTVTADADPTQALSAYVSPMTAAEAQRAADTAAAQAAVDVIAAKAPETRTDTEKVLLGLAWESVAVTVPSTPEEPVEDEVRAPTGDEEPVEL